MTEEEVLDLISEFTVVERAKMTRSATLDELDITSLDFLSVFFELQDRFGITVDEATMPDMETMGDFVDYVMGLVNGPTS